MSMDDIAFAICRGGWPRTLNKKTQKAALRQVTEYFEAIARSDISRVDGVDRDEYRAKRLMRSYARLQGAMAGIPTIVEDMKTNEPESMSDETVASYIKALRRKIQNIQGSGAGRSYSYVGLPVDSISKKKSNCFVIYLNFCNFAIYFIYYTKE